MKVQKMTAFQEEREKRDLSLVNDYNEMMAVKGQSKTRVNEFLMKKYGLHSTGTIYTIRKRVELRLAQEGASI